MWVRGAGCGRQALFAFGKQPSFRADEDTGTPSLLHGLKSRWQAWVASGAGYDSFLKGSVLFRQIEGGPLAFLASPSFFSPC